MALSVRLVGQAKAVEAMVETVHGSGQAVVTAVGDGILHERRLLRNGVTRIAVSTRLSRKIAYQATVSRKATNETTMLRGNKADTNR